MKFNNIISIVTIAILVVITSCIKDLNTIPIDEDETTSATLYKDPAAYRQILAKLYAGIALTGQEGPAGQGDLVGIDEGFSSYLRNYWKLQELTTDEAINGWGDDGLSDFHVHGWTSSNPFIRGMYYRIYFQITLTNSFIRQTSEENLDYYEIGDEYRTEIAYYQAEARFLRALSYWHALDMFGNVPFVTEEDGIGAYLPDQINQSDLFKYIENELLDIEDKIVVATQNEYGRADQAAVWTLLAKLYLNAEVYTGTGKYTECLTYCNKIIAEGYTLHPEYDELFLADNHLCSGSIFPIVFDGLVSQTWGGTTFLVHAAVGGSMSIIDYGIDFGWGGNRTTKALVAKFGDITSGSLVTTDTMRALFHTDGQNLEITDIPSFIEGYAITKYRNITSTGQPGSHETHVDNDFHMFRLADVYLMYVEAGLRGGSGGSDAQALLYINALRDRAKTDNVSSINLDFILDERARELYWEGHRRTDLIRFGKYTGSTYLWPWKGGVDAGTSIADFYALFPIPADDITANPYLVQNDGY